MTRVARKKVLIVEDDHLVRSMYQTILGDEFDCTYATSWPEAVKEIESDKTWDLLLTDFDLKTPTHDGLAVASRARSRWPFLPILMVSGHGEDHPSIQQFLRLSAVKFLSKESIGHAVPRLVSEAISAGRKADREHYLKNRENNLSLLEGLLRRSDKPEARASLEERIGQQHEEIARLREEL